MRDNSPARTWVAALSGMMSGFQLDVDRLGVFGYEDNGSGELENGRIGEEKDGG